MSVAGRKPMPAPWKAMTGNAGRRPLDNDSGVNFEPGIPEAPDFLDAAARAEWDRIAPLLNTAGLLATVDGAQLALYCQAYSRWRKAELKLQEMEAKDAEGCGIVTKSPNGFDQLGYWMVVANKAQEQVSKALAEFGMSPVARARVKAIANQGDLFGNDQLGSYLKAGQQAPKAA